LRALNAERRTPNAERAVSGVRLRDGRILSAPRVVVTTGTFLRGLMHQGETRTPGGRMGDFAALGLSESFERLGLRLLRHKTGTPCRLHADSIRWDLCEEQPGDEPPPPFSFLTGKLALEQLSCWTCRTTPAAHACILANLHRAPLYNGQITSVGPRYCPSIEDKVVRFKDRDSHHLFLEPEGRRTKEIYVNGLSTSLPLDVQDAVLAAIPALAQAHVLRYGYAVEYDVVAPDQMDHSLEVKTIAGLYLAGQINGTSGYEEAAGQGLVAGANAALTLGGKPPLILSRADAYIGVLIDDLVTRLPVEPYRMFTSRAEHRLHLRADNADRRLTPLAARLGLVDAGRAAVSAKEAAIQRVLLEIPDQTARRIAGEAMTLEQVAALVPGLADEPPVVREQVWIELRYATYLARQQSTIERLGRFRDLPLPADFDYARIATLSTEGRLKLIPARPRTLGEAGRLSGVSQVDVETLWAVIQARGKGDGT
jgi:tRNA uridine 5-carboxymethylaminomethyl modification enzyme